MTVWTVPLYSCSATNPCLSVPTIVKMDLRILMRSPILMLFAFVILMPRHYHAFSPAQALFPFFLLRQQKTPVRKFPDWGR